MRSVTGPNSPDGNGGLFLRKTVEHLPDINTQHPRWRHSGFAYGHSVSANGQFPGSFRTVSDIAEEEP